MGKFCTWFAGHRAEFGLCSVLTTAALIGQTALFGTTAAAAPIALNCVSSALSTHACVFWTFWPVLLFFSPISGRLRDNPGVERSRSRCNAPGALLPVVSANGRKGCKAGAAADRTSLFVSSFRKLSKDLAPSRPCRPNNDGDRQVRPLTLERRMPASLVLPVR